METLWQCVHEARRRHRATENAKPSELTEEHKQEMDDYLRNFIKLAKADWREGRKMAKSQSRHQKKVKRD